MAAISWREDARSRIQSVLLEHEAQSLLLGEPMDKKALAKSLTDAYPYGERKHHPYKIWCSERQVALAFFDLMGSFGYSARHYSEWSFNKIRQPAKSKQAAASVDAGQLSLLG